MGWIGFVSSVANTVCVILVAKRKISNYVWGVIGVLAYAFVAFSFQNTGEWTMNLFYYFPANLIGWFMWNRQRSSGDSSEVDARRMTLKQSVLAYGLTAIGIVAFALLINLESVQVFFYGAVGDYGFGKQLLDSFTTIASVAAMLLMLWRFQEQWVLWIVIDVASIILWIVVFNPMMIVQWSAMLVNAVYGYIKWRPRKVVEAANG